MARKSSVPTNKEYTRQQIITELDNLNIELIDNKIVTKYYGKVIKKFTVSKKYYNFDFCKFIKLLLPELDTDITAYNFKISGGIQELRLIGKEEIINGEKYARAIYIINSSDESRTLQLMFGVYRLKCNSSFLIEKSLIHNNARHYESDFLEKLDIFKEGIKKMSTVQNLVISNLKNLKNQDIQMSLIAANMNKTKTGVSKFNSLRHKMVSSETDRLSDMAEEHMKVMKANIDQVEKKKYDMSINAYKAIQAYAEVFRNRDCQEIRRELMFFLDCIK